MKQKKYLLSLVLLICSFTLYSQNDVNSVNKETTVEMAKPGTYQIVVAKKNKQQQVFTKDLLIEIEKHRLENREYIWNYSNSVVITIPSRTKINSNEFKPLEEIIYE